MSRHVPKHESRRLRRFARADKAVSALEYAILVGVIAAAIGGVLVTFGGNLETGIEAMSKKVKTITPPAIPLAPF